MTEAERKRAWRLANPDKYREQKRRYREKLRSLQPPKEEVSPEERLARLKAKQAGYARAFKERHGEEYKKRKAKNARDCYRRKKGIPLDAPVGVKPHAHATEEERRAAKRAANRRAWAKKNGTTVEEIDARNAARKAAREAREQCPKSKIPAKISERKTRRTIRVKPSTSPASTRSEITPASIPRPVSRGPKPGAIWMRAFRNW